MSHSIYQKDNGNFCVFSTVVDDWIILEATKEELAEWYAEKEKDRMLNKLTGIEDGTHDEHPLKHSFEEAVEIAGSHPDEMEAVSDD